jgi:NACHT domain
MKFLVEDQRTKDALNKWAKNCSINSFFLWNAGTPMQRSLQGLLCLLLYQLLMNDSSVGKHLLATQPELLSKTNYEDWSDTELEGVFIQGISISAQPLCIFLDGLDEIDREEGPFHLTDLIERLRSKSTAKLCISSRPEIPLQDAFSKYPKLRVQDLTKADIGSFVADSLQKDFHFWNDTPDGKEN